MLLTIAPGLLVLLAIGLLYLYNIDGWLINDDEGTDLYEIWRIAEGDNPGADLITEQPPVFLLAGVGLGLLSGFNVAVLRGATALLVLASGWPVFLIGRELWGPRAGLMGMTLYLLNREVHSMARLYRPDPWMLAFCAVGLCLFALSQTRQKRWFMPLAGMMCGLGTLCKLFGVLPLGGCILFLAWQALRGRSTVRRAVEDSALLVVPFALITTGGILAFYPPGSSYYSSVLGQHWQMGREAGLITIMAKGLVGLVTFLRGNLVFLLALPLFPKLATSHSVGERVLAWQLPTGLAFLFLSRPIWPRYWLYLIPALSLIPGFLVDRILAGVESRLGPRRRLLAALVSLLPLGAAMMQSAPVIVRNLRWTEHDTPVLAAMIAEHTAPDDIVLADYAGLNFHARRRSIPQASIIATGRIMAGFVTGSELITEIEARDVRMVVLHVPGGIAPPTHLIYLHDYQAFYSYLVQHFCLLDRFDRAGQLFEIYLQCPQQQATGLLVGGERLEREAVTRHRPRPPCEPSGSLGRPRRGQDGSSTRDC